MAEQNSGTPKTILCVDDIPESLSIRKLMLEIAGYRVLTSTSPSEGIKVLESETVDLVVMDYRFPGNTNDGGWLAHEIREHWSGVKTIMLSGYPEIPKKVIDSVDCFCLKGGEPGELTRAISSLLNVELNRQSLDDAKKRSAELRETAFRLREEARRNRRSARRVRS